MTTLRLATVMENLILVRHYLPPSTSLSSGRAPFSRDHIYVIMGGLNSVDSNEYLREMASPGGCVSVSDGPWILASPAI